MNVCKCGLTPQLENIIECSMSRWRVACECGRVTDTFVYPKNAERAWNDENSELLGNYTITEKGELAIENQKNSDRATYWFEKHNEAQEEVDDLKKKISELDTENEKLINELENMDYAEYEMREEIKQLREEVKYWTNQYNEQVQGREKDMMSLEAISRLLGVSR